MCCPPVNALGMMVGVWLHHLSMVDRSWARTHSDEVMRREECPSVNFRAGMQVIGDELCIELCIIGPSLQVERRQVEAQA
jgi:hypothetical protein